MRIFGSLKKKEEKATNCCCSCSSNKEEQVVNKCCSKEVKGVCCIKVLGAECKACHNQYEHVKEAVKKLGLNIEVEYITDMAKVMEYGVMSMPAIVVNEKVEAFGKVLKTAEVEKLLQRYDA